MTYELGVDLGTTYTAAAVRRQGVVRVVQLAADSQSIPSVIAVRDDGELIAGEAADRRAITHPGRAIREFKRRFGDAAPIVLSGRAHSAHDLTARMLAEVIDRTSAIEGGRPSALALAHPAGWGPFRLDALRTAAAVVGFDEVTLVPEPVAAALANGDRLPEGELVAVYDLGGGTFDAAVVRTGSSIEILGTPEGVERLGGADFDQAVLAHVDSVLDGAAAAVHVDPDQAASLSRLRDECRRAKEALSTDSEAEVPVHLDTVRSSVRLTRSELESMVRPRLGDSLAVLDRVVSSSGSSWDEVCGVLLVGGASRMPVVGMTIAEHTGRPLFTASNPSFSIAVGTVMALPPVTEASSPAREVAPPRTATRDSSEDREVLPSASAAPRSRRGVLAVVGLAAAVAIVVGLLASGGDDPSGGDAPGSSVTAAPGPTASVSGEPSSTATSPETATPSALLVGPVRLTPTRCEGAAEALAGATDVAVGSDHVYVLSGGVVRALSVEIDGGNCALALDSTLTERLQVERELTDIDVTIDGLLVGAGVDGGVVVTTTGTRRVCNVIRDRVTVDGSTGLAFTWQSGVGAQVVRVGADGCSTPVDVDVTAGVMVAVADGAEEYLVGARVEGVVKLVRADSGAIDWAQGGAANAPDGYRSIDGIGRCGGYICVLDASRMLIHAVAPDGEHAGSAPAATLAAAPEVMQLVTATDGAVWLLARDGLRIDLVRAAIG